MERKNLILLTLIVITAGALVSREYSKVGFVLSVCAMMGYLCVDIVKIVKYASILKKADNLVKTRLAVWALFLIITLKTVLSGSVSYFFVLVLLGADYVLTLTSRENEKGD